MKMGVTARIHTIGCSTWRNRIRALSGLTLTSNTRGMGGIADEEQMRSDDASGGFRRGTESEESDSRGSEDWIEIGSKNILPHSASWTCSVDRHGRQCRICTYRKSFHNSIIMLSFGRGFVMVANSFANPKYDNSFVLSANCLGKT